MSLHTGRAGLWRVASVACALALLDVLEVVRRTGTDRQVLFQTDRPLALANLLRASGLHEAPR
jgi:hypothetical protein